MRILIIRFSSLGDIILTQAVLEQFKRIYPTAKLDFLTKPAFAPLVSTYFPVENVFTDYKSITKLLDLRKNHYDLVIDLHKKFNSWLAKTIIHGKKTVTYNKKRSLRKKIVAHKTNLSINSTVSLYNTVFEKLKLNYDFIEPTISLNKSSSNLLPDKNTTNIVIFPGATHNTKRIPCHKLISFINNHDHPGTNFYLLGSLGEKELIQIIVQKSNKTCFDLAGKFNLVELVSAVNEADLVITNDSGPMHIAAALKKAQIAFFGSTNTSLGFRPLNEKAIVISHPVECSPCSLHGQKTCPRKHFACMQNITVEEIYQAFKTLLKR
ncbi:glycosyltransferase family 9 protein [bacterium]|nr:glycosyltransferase family 9 protein [bacterium]